MLDMKFPDIFALRRDVDIGEARGHVFAEMVEFSLGLACFAAHDGELVGRPRGAAMQQVRKGLATGYRMHAGVSHPKASSLRPVCLRLRALTRQAAIGRNFAFPRRGMRPSLQEHCPS
jgi:hypothetical protein